MLALASESVSLQVSLSGTAVLTSTTTLCFVPLEKRRSDSAALGIDSGVRVVLFCIEVDHSFIDATVS